MKKRYTPPAIISVQNLSRAEQERWKQVLRSARDQPVVLLPFEKPGVLRRLWNWLWRW